MQKDKTYKLGKKTSLENQKEKSKQTRQGKGESRELELELESSVVEASKQCKETD